MRKVKHPLLILFILFFLCSCLNFRLLADGTDISLQHINTKGYAVRVVYRDMNGIVWLGTSSGLLSLPQLESRNPSGYHRNLSHVNMSIKRISGDSRGRLWIKNNYNEYHLYDPQQNKFLFDASETLSLKGIRISNEFTVQTNDEKRIWIWKDNLLYWLNDDATQAESISIGDDEQWQSVWSKGDFLTGLSKRAVYIISMSRKEVVRTIMLPEGLNTRDHMFVSDDGSLWIWDDNHLWKNAGEKWQQVLEAASDITSMAQDEDQRLWVGTRSDGIYLLDILGKKLRQMQHKAEDRYGLLSDRVESVTFDPASQSMWIAYTKGGLSVYEKKNRSSYLHSIAALSSRGAITEVLSFASSKAHRGVWIGLEENGVWLHDKAGDTKVIDDGSAVALYANDKGDLWAGIYRQGLLHRSADGQQRLFLEGTSPYAIAEDDQGHIFTALLGSGVWQLNPDNGEAVHTQLKPNYVLDLKYHHHKLYAATTEGLYVSEIPRQWHMLNDGHFHYLCIDHQGYIWLIGNEGSEGLTLLDPSGRNIPLPDNLSSAPLKSIAIDRDGNVWTTSTSELFMLHYDPEADQPLESHSFVVNADASPVFYNPHTALIDDDGLLWLGATTGYQCINTHNLIAQNGTKSDARRLVLGAISINDNLLSPGQMLGDRILLDKDVTFIHDLQLQYNENNLVIECSKPYNERYSEVGAFYYQLKGFSDVWHRIEGHTITLSNLPPGHYQLLTRTQSSEAYQLLTISIAPPFWLSWWAFCLYALFIAAIIYGIVRYVRHHRAYEMNLRHLKMQQEQQRQMNELKLRFFTNISHDLRTPLSLIIAPVEELIKSEKPDSDTLHSSLDIVLRNARQLLSLVNQILDFRRLETGNEHLLLSYGDIVSHLHDVCESFSLKAKKEHIRFDFITSAERIETMFDRDKTTKIMMNLLSNAFKFTDAGGSITVQLDISDRQIIISVADNGIGISDADKEHLFDRFYQVNSDSRDTMGSGIGLHIVREYVLLQGGQITISDNTAEGHGSIFRIALPLKKDRQPQANESAPAAAAEVTSDNASDEALAQNERPTLLLVDDNQDLLSYMSQSLHDCYHMLTAPHGVAAMQLLSERDVDLIISDVMMPEMDGLELCRRVKSDISTSHIPVILLTAKTMTDDELNGLKSGADDYITKPFSMEILRQRIHNLLERHQKMHERFATEVDVSPSEIAITSLDEQFITKAIAVVENHIAEPDFSIEQLSEEMGVHRAQLYKKLQHLTGRSPQQFVRLLRLKRGRQLLEQSGLYVSEVAYKVGFNSPRIFSKYFKEEFGVTPRDFSTQ